MNIIILAKNGALYMLPLPTPQKIKGNFLERKTKRMWRGREQITKPRHKCIHRYVVCQLKLNYILTKRGPES